MSAELRVGLIGCGRLAEIGYVPALHTAQGARLVAVADPEPARRARVAALGGHVQGFAGVGALLDGAPVDAVVLATPASTHVADARLAAANGVAVLVEKPPAVDAAGAAELAALTPPPWIGFNRRFDAGVRAVRAATPADGRIDLLLELCYRRRGWGAHTVADDALLDLGAHLVDLARWLSGGEASSVANASISHDRATFEVTLGRAHARVRCVADRPHEERAEVRDAHGTLLARHRQGGLVAGLRGRLTPRRGGHMLVASLAAQLEAFARAARGAAEPSLASATDGHAAMAVLDAVRACAASDGQAVPVAVRV